MLHLFYPSHKNILLYFLIIVIFSNYCPWSICNFSIYRKVTLYFYYISYKNIVLTLINSSFSLTHWFAEVSLQIPNSHMLYFWTLSSVTLLLIYSIVSCFSSIWFILNSLLNSFLSMWDRLILLMASLPIQLSAVWCSSYSHQNVKYNLPNPDSGLSHLFCFAQWNISRVDEIKCSKMPWLISTSSQVPLTVLCEHAYYAWASLMEDEISSRVIPVIPAEGSQNFDLKFLSSFIIEVYLPYKLSCILSPFL